LFLTTEYYAGFYDNKMKSCTVSNEEKWETEMFLDTEMQKEAVAYS
jgi:hypothetical protein